MKVKEYIVIYWNTKENHHKFVYAYDTAEAQQAFIDWCKDNKVNLYDYTYSIYECKLVLGI